MDILTSNGFRLKNVMIYRVVFSNRQVVMRALQKLYSH